MNKFILVLAFWLTPFFLQADIWTDGMVDVKAPKSEMQVIINSATHPALIGQELSSFGTGFCADYYDQYYTAKLSTGQYKNPRGELLQSSTTFKQVKCTHDLYNDYACSGGIGDYCNLQGESSIGTFNAGAVEILTSSCPPDGFPYHTYSITNEEGDVTGCANPSQISQIDECNVNSTQEYLSVPVTVSSGCFETANGSSCKYNAVGFGGGVQAYALDLEGDCYSEILPDIEGSELPTPEDSGSMCVEWGGTGLICPENPEDHCSGGSSTYSGGSIASCDVGCGQVNGVFTCIDNDLDNDGLPDFLDPDIDGDGIPNGEDLDSDGDGQDDPITNGGNGSGGGTGSGSVDLTPVVNKLEEIKKSISETNVQLIQSPTEDAASFYTSTYEDGLQGIWDESKADFESSEFVVFLDTFKQVPSGGTAAASQMCFNLGALGNLGCGELSPDSRIWAAIRIFILVTAGFLCRAILFGG